MAGWESGPGKASTFMSRRDLSLLQTCRCSRCPELPRRPPARRWETEAGLTRRAQPSRAPAPRGEPGLPAFSARTLTPPAALLLLLLPPRPARDKARSPRREAAGRLPRARRAPPWAQDSAPPPLGGGSPRPSIEAAPPGPPRFPMTSPAAAGPASGPGRQAA